MSEPTWTPACLTADELAGWDALNRRITGKGRATSPCADCLPSFSDEMRPLGRCNGIPRGAALEEQPMEPVTMRATAVEVTAPCPSCVHRPVCRIADGLAEIRRLSVDVPPFDDAIGIELAATVSCAHFARAKGDQVVKGSKMSPEARANMSKAAQARIARDKAERDGATA